MLLSFCKYKQARDVHALYTVSSGGHNLMFEIEESESFVILYTYKDFLQDLTSPLKKDWDFNLRFQNLQKPPFSIEQHKMASWLENLFYFG